MRLIPRGPREAAVRDLARGLERSADRARDAGEHQAAAALYDEALKLRPDRADLRVQRGHMLKECGRLAEAEAEYTAAATAMPRDADLQVQLGHLHKSAGELARAVAAYENAAAMRPGWPVPRLELARLLDAGWIGDVTATAPDDAADAAGLAAPVPPLAPELAPHAEPRHPEWSDGVHSKRLGRHERTRWGVLPTLRGVEAVRGFVVSAVPILTIEIAVGDQLVYRGAPRGGYPLPGAANDGLRRKYVYNVWLDFGGFRAGRYEVQVRAIDAEHEVRRHVAATTIAAPMALAVPDSDGLVPPADPRDPRALDAQVNGRPSMIRAGRRVLFATPPRSVLVQRVDQLGDLVVSVPALRRLRALFPGARLVGLIAPANADLAGSLALFDEIVTVDFPEDRVERRRTMTLAAQRALRERLAPHAFDLAIDLSENVWSRLLLPLSGAAAKVGFISGDMPGMTVEVAGFTHDRWDNHEIVPHTNKLLGLVEWLAAMMRDAPNIVPRAAEERAGAAARLAALGVPAGRGFVAMHDGARLRFSRWPGYAELARLLIERTDLAVVMLTDDEDATVPAALAASERYRLINRRLGFDDLDRLLAGCAVFVGNDSGPKHLAALRGAPVVSLHMARNNWNEWGQESGGLIMSRKVPCAGCLIHYDPEDCGRDFACIRGIAPEEVFGAVMSLVGGTR